jgi:hypothetical protein
LHRDALTLELPCLAGYDRLEAAWYRQGTGGGREVLGSVQLTPGKFHAAASDAAWESLGLCGGCPPGAATADGPSPSGKVTWPEDYHDPDILEFVGDPSEVDRRINIVVVPDGYTYGEKAVMRSHFDSLTAFFKGKTPLREHDPFLNYILVYAYSEQSGTDQCDCSIVLDTAMNTRFPAWVPICGASENRCLYYEGGSGVCDPDTSIANIVAAELRSPADDRTLIMVNTPRLGGCGGYRAVFAGAAWDAADTAVHEMAHSLVGLDDEYVSYSSCGGWAYEMNTSMDAKVGAWPEWIPEIGAPREGAQYYQQCIYRPEVSCEMRALFQPFCHVCNQYWALMFFGHYRISPTAPISGQAPASPVGTQIGLPNGFEVLTRLATGGGVTNEFLWLLQGPGYPDPTPVGSGVPQLELAFGDTGTFTLTCEVTADTNFIKRVRNGANQESVQWNVEVSPVPEVSCGEIFLDARSNGARDGSVDISFEDTGSLSYNLYVSTVPGTLPFLVASSEQGNKVCALDGLIPSGGRMSLSGYVLEEGITGPLEALYFLVTADNGAGTEGPLGLTSSGVERASDSSCAH